MRRSLKRIHIVGCAPRSGTTLLFELITSCFEVEPFGEHEMSVFRTPETRAAVVCSKNPQDILVARAALVSNRDLWLIHLMRDPRDVIVSRHARDPEKYWCNLRVWKNRRKSARAVEGHRRFLTVRYEDLVRSPDAVQDRIDAWAPFLIRSARFTDYEAIARPSARSIEALGGVRPISAERIGTWKSHKPRVVAQLELHGPIDGDLIALGYEADASWRRELDAVEPDNGLSHFPDHVPAAARAGRAIRRRLAIAKYRLRLALRRIGSAIGS